METHAVIVADRTDIIRMWSAGAQKPLGYDAKDAVGPLRQASRHGIGSRNLRQSFSGKMARSKMSGRLA